MPRPRRRPAKKRTSVAVAAIKVLDERVRKCERALGLDRKPIGFDAIAVTGERIEQDEDDPEIEELP